MTVPCPLKPDLLISDLHLSPERPEVTRIFLAFLEGPARQAGALFILGDLFDYWLGDDDLDSPLNRTVARALSELSARGVCLRLMVGNRDFLLGRDFADAAGAKLLSDPSVLELAGTPTLLTHGDALCTDDLPYQAFRQQSRHPGWQAAFLALSLEERRAIATGYRRQSEEAKGAKTEAIMDVNAAAVAGLFREQGCVRLIHGHTHRPARHHHGVDGRSCERWVLPDWRTGEGAVWLECDESGCRYGASKA